MLRDVLQVLSNGGPKKHFACQQLHIQRHFDTRQLVDLIISFFRYCISSHTPFFSHTINISNNQTLILDITGRRRICAPTRASTRPAYMSVFTSKGFPCSFFFVLVKKQSPVPCTGWKLVLCVTCWRHCVPWVQKQVEAPAKQDHFWCWSAS